MQSVRFRLNHLIVAVVTVVAVAATLSYSFAARAQGDDADFDLQLITSELVQPVYLTHAGDGSGRLFVVEKGGTIRIIQNGRVLSQPFLDIRERVGNSGEAGFLSVAFPPNYENDGYFFVYYNHKDKNLVEPEPEDNGNNDGYDTVVARFRVTADPNRADDDSESRVLVRNQPFTNHNGGLITFGPDGYLYIGLGDGGSSDDPFNMGQNLNSLLGKILRIAVGANGTYTVPSDNPYMGRNDARSEIWDWGLRNPWRFSFDRLTGDMLIGDVGQHTREEISVHPAGTPGGLNFGWDCREGDFPHNTTANCSGPFIDPIVAYGRDEGQSVTGGYVYRGSVFSAFQGRYFFADFAQGQIWSTQRSGSGWTAKRLEVDTKDGIASFGEDEAGELYVVAIGGKLFRIIDKSAPSVALGGSTFAAGPSSGVAGDIVRYTLVVRNGGTTTASSVEAVIDVPAALSYQPGSLQATSGAVDAGAAPRLRWQGAVGAGQQVTIIYDASIRSGANGPVSTAAQVTLAGTSPLVLTAPLTVRNGPIGQPDPDFFLPGTQPGHLVDAIVDPSSCQGCHTEPIYGAWRGSMMSQSGRDPLFWAALHVANQDVENAGEYCLRCHTPRGWFDGRSHPGDGSALESTDLTAGVACEVCHRMVDPQPSGGDAEAVSRDIAIRGVLSPTLPAGHVGSAMMILDPEDNRRGPFDITPAPPHPKATWRTDFLGQGGDPVTEARVCGTCHNVDNPAFSWNEASGRYEANAPDTPAPSFAKGDLFPIERTFDEWLNSEYATANGVYAPQFAGSKPNGIVRTCQDCHMPRTIGPAAVGDVVRDCVTNGCLPQHAFAGANTWAPRLLQDTRWRLAASQDALHLNAAIASARMMLNRAATLTIDFDPQATQKQAVVRVTNETGHKLPTGYPEGRRMWLTVRAYDDAGRLVYQSGAYNSATGVLASDPAPKVYEAKFGIDDGATLTETFHFVLNNAVVKDNRIPPRGYTVAGYDQPGLRPVGASFADGQHWDETIYALPDDAAYVAAYLYYQTASKEYIDFLRARGGEDGAMLGTLWDELKSPPELMASAIEPARREYLPLVGR